ncbi:unnamed protein product, partial [Discosporangium mesarthrocarpum]
MKLARIDQKMGCTCKCLALLARVLPLGAAFLNPPGIWKGRGATYCLATRELPPLTNIFGGLGSKVETSTSYLPLVYEDFEEHPHGRGGWLENVDIDGEHSMFVLERTWPDSIKYGLQALAETAHPFKVEVVRRGGQTSGKEAQKWLTTLMVPLETRGLGGNGQAAWGEREDM